MFRVSSHVLPTLFGLLICSANAVRAEWDFWGVTYSGDPSIGNHVWTIDSRTGDRTLRTTRDLGGYAWQWSNSYVDEETGELVVHESDGGLHSYDLDTDTWTDRGDAWSADYQEIFIDL